MHDDGYFREEQAARYDEQSADLSTPEAVNPVVDVLAELARSSIWEKRTD